MKVVKCLPEFEYFTVFLKNKKNFISKISRSKVTDYAALNFKSTFCKLTVQNLVQHCLPMPNKKTLGIIELIILW